MNLRTMALLSIPALVLAGCGSSAGGPEDGGACTAGQTEACTCTGGVTGVATCAAGAYGACVCAAADGGSDAGTPDAGSSDAGSSDAGSADAGSADAGEADGGSGDAGVDAGTPTAMFSTAPIDFGLQGCGAPAPLPLALSVANAGTGTLTYSASLSSSTNFTITGGASGSIAPGIMTSISIAAAAVPTTATAGTSITTTLVLTTNDPAHLSTSIPVSITPQGAVLTLNPANVAFPGTVVYSSASLYPVTLLNTGNASVDVAFGPATNADFGAVYTGSDAGPADAGDAPVALAPSATVGLPGLAATFTPTRTANETASIPLVVTGAVCSGSATALTASGTGLGGIYYTDAGTDLYVASDGGAPGLVPCGQTALPTSLSFTNVGNEAFNWSAALTSGAYFTIPADTQGSAPPPLIPGATAKVTITPSAAVPFPSATTADLYSDTLTITTTAPGDVPHVFTIHQTAYGAILVTLPGSSYNFGEVLPGLTASETFSVYNNGNAPASVTVLAADAGTFDVTPAVAAATVLPATPLQPTVVFTAPATGTSATYNGSLSVTNAGGSATAGLCAALPANVALSGTSESGTFNVTPAAITFGEGTTGLVPCGTQANSATLTFRNGGSSAYTIAPSLEKGSASWYTLSAATCSGASPNTVVAGGDCTISVVPKAIPATSPVTPDYYGDIIEVTTNIPGDAPHYIPLTMTAQGAIITGERQTVAFGPTNAGTTNSFLYGFTNTGNAPATLSIPTVSGSPFSWSSTYEIKPGQVNDALKISFAPSSTTNYTASMDFVAASGTALCAPLPYSGAVSNGFNTISLTGSGITPDLAVPNSSIQFSPGACGTSPTGTQAITITDDFTVNGMVATVPVVMTLPTADHFMLQTSPACVEDCTSTVQVFQMTTGQQVTVNVLPAPIPQAASIANHSISDVVSVGIEGLPTHLIYLQDTALGALLSLAPTSLTMAAQAGKTSNVGGTFYVVNSGNLQTAGALSLSLGLTTLFSVSPSGLFGVPAPDGDNDQQNARPFSVTFAPASTGSPTATVTLNASNGLTGLCQSALPAAINISATGQ